MNPRLNALSDAEFADVLVQTAVMVQDHFGLEMRFERGENFAITELFELIPEPVEEVALSWASAKALATASSYSCLA